MNKACELINQIQNFDKNIYQLTEVYEQSQFIIDEIVLATTYSEIDLRIFQNLKDYLNGVVQDKLNHCQQLITKKQKNKQPQDNSIVQIFEHKTAKALVNTSESTAKQVVQPPIYNMRVMDSQQVSEQWTFTRFKGHSHTDLRKLACTQIE
jgi:phage replication initiation protein